MATVCSAWGKSPGARHGARTRFDKIIETTHEKNVAAEPCATIARKNNSDLHQFAPERFVLDHATALVFGVSRKALRTSMRGGRQVAMVRQVGMYLAHVVLERNLTEAGRLFGRDRTTAAHACSVVEDLRENAIFDRAVAELESIVRLQMQRNVVTPRD